jgi:hypothetical protein
MTKRQFDKLDPELLKAMEEERWHNEAWEPFRVVERKMAECSEVALYFAALAKFRAGFVRSEVVTWLRAAADRIEENGLGDDPPREWDAPPWDQVEGL